MQLLSLEVVFETLAQISLEADGPQFLRGNVAIEVFAHAIEALSKAEEEAHDSVFSLGANRKWIVCLQVFFHVLTIFAIPC